MRLDSLNLQLLRLIQTNNRLSTEQMGNQIGLSATAVQRRIKDLRNSGIIRKEVAVLDTIAVGGFVTIIVDVTIKQGGLQNLEVFKNTMLDCLHVQQCYYVTGKNDFIIIITIKNMLEYEKLTRKLFLSNDNIQKFNSTVVMENVKVGLNIPI